MRRPMEHNSSSLSHLKPWGYTLIYPLDVRVQPLVLQALCVAFQETHAPSSSMAADMTSQSLLLSRMHTGALAGRLDVGFSSP